MLLTAATVVTGRDVLRPGWIEISGETIAALGPGAPGRPVDRELGQVTVVPGFVDTHVHGGGGGSFSGGDAQTATAVGLHRRHGTTTLMASLVTEAPDELLRQVRALTGPVADGLVAGIHLEGPWLAVERCGAHDPALLRDPDAQEIDRLLAAGRGAIRMVTLAPERHGALDAIRQVVGAGVVAAVGHTDAGYQQTRAAVAAGATVATHLFNAMRPIHHREPGPVIALLEDPAVTVEIIGDGVHLDHALYHHVTVSAGPERVSLVTDAMSAAGGSDGRYRIGPLAVDVTDGVAHLAGTTTIAGSTATMDRLFQFAAGDPVTDAGLLRAVSQSSLNPARALGLPSPALIPGAVADLVVLDAELQVSDVLYHGHWVDRDSTGSVSEA